MSSVIRIDDDIAHEIERISEVLKINTVQSSRLVFLGRFAKNGRPPKSAWGKTLGEARVDHGRKRVAAKIIYIV